MSVRNLPVLSLLCAALLLASAGSARGDSATPVHAHYAGEGPWAVAVDAVTYASGQTGVVYRPLANDSSETFPVVVWGNGSGSTPEGGYALLLRRIASFGYVIAATNHEQVGTGLPLLESLAHLRDLHDDPLFPLHGQVDFGAVAAIGHSQGAGGSMRAVSLTGDFHTLAPLALPNPLFVSPGDEYDAADVGVPVLFFGAVGDFISDTPVNEAFFNSAPDAAAMAMVADSQAGFPHLDWQGDGGVSRAYIIAWLDFILRGDAFAAAAFTGGDPEFFRHPDFVSQQGKCLPGGPLPVLLPAHRAVPEGDGGLTTHGVTVTLSQACQREVTVQWATVDGLAQPEAGVDYQADAGTLTFAPGETSGTIPFTVFGDTLFEPGEEGYEWAAIRLAAPVNATLGDEPLDAYAFVLIGNDDLPPGCD